LFQKLIFTYWLSRQKVYCFAVVFVTNVAVKTESIAMQKLFFFPIFNFVFWLEVFFHMISFIFRYLNNIVRNVSKKYLRFFLEISQALSTLVIMKIIIIWMKFSVVILLTSR